MRAVVSPFVALMFVLALAYLTQPTFGAADVKASATAVSSGAQTLAGPPFTPPGPPPIIPPSDKPNKSKKNPNDGKDTDPDDGDAGTGNDGRIKPGDGPVEP